MQLACQVKITKTSKKLLFSASLLCFCLPPPLLLYITYSPTTCPLNAPESSNLCVCPYSPYRHIWLSPFPLCFTYSYLLQISVFTFYSPCSFKQPSNSFHSSFFLYFHSLFGVFCLSTLYFTLLPVLAFFSHSFFIGLTAYSHFLLYLCVFFRFTVLFSVT